MYQIWILHWKFQLGIDINLLGILGIQFFLSLHFFGMQQSFRSLHMSLVPQSHL